jgi:uncharacterized protein YndB with AHSA1/START domain
MVKRQVVVPVPRQQVWAALTEPAHIGAWFGAEVQWDLRPGGAARFSAVDGSERAGVVEAVDDEAELRFRWWPVETEGEPPSEVTYTLEDDPDGTRLTITEEPLPGSASLCSALQFGPWDGRLVGLWAHAAGHLTVCA